MRVLSIETSAFPASVAILEDTKIISEYYINTGFTHSETLMPMVASVLDTAKLTMKDIDLISVANGPGSFTGVRIGISTAKGLAVPNNTDCMAVSSLESLAYNLYEEEGEKLIYSCIDARVKQIYNGVFELKDGVITRVKEDRVITNEDVIKELSELKSDKEIWLTGDYADKLYESLKDIKGIKLAPQLLRYQRASSVAYAAEKKAVDGVMTASEIQPMYLQLPQATRELNKRRGIS